MNHFVHNQVVKSDYVVAVVVVTMVANELYTVMRAIVQQQSQICWQLVRPISVVISVVLWCC